MAGKVDFLVGNDRPRVPASAPASASDTSALHDRESKYQLRDSFADTDAAFDEQPPAAEPARPDLALQRRADPGMAGVPITTAEGCAGRGDASSD